MISYLKKRLQNFIFNSLCSATDEVKSNIFNSLYSTNLKLIEKKYRNEYLIDPDFKFNGIYIFLYGKGKIQLGKNSYIGDYSTIQSGEGLEVIIGEKCSISHNVRIYTTSNVANQDFSASVLIEKNASVVIEDYVWIGANVFINPGVKIGKNSVIGANSVITKDIPANSIFAGVPAKLIKMKSDIN